MKPDDGIPDDGKSSVIYPPHQKVCQNCRHFKPGKGTPGAGWCRCRSPRVIPGTFFNPASTVFPIVSVGIWCGEWTEGPRE